MPKTRRCPSLFESLETRQLMAASAVKVVDSGGPIASVVESGGQIFATSQHASGSGVSQIYLANGAKSKTRLLLDLSKPGATISSIADLAATDDGRIFFTAVAAGGRHLFQLNTRTGAFTQISTGANVFYTNAVAAGNRLFVYEKNGETIHTVEPGSTSTSQVTRLKIDTTFFASGSDVYFIGPAESLYRCNGTASGTVKVSGGLRVNRGDFFTTNEHAYFEGTLNNNISLYRVGTNESAPTKLADDFSLFNTNHAELGEYVYFSGFYYNTTPGKAKGLELYRVKIADGTVEIAADVNPGSGGGVDGIAAIGNSIYFVNADGEFLSSQGTGDRELYRFDTITKKTTLVTSGNALYPVSIGGGVLGSYYFVAAPTKDDARFGSRVLYRTDPVTDQIEQIADQPVINDSDGDPITDVKLINAGSRGLFFTAATADFSRDTDIFFVQTPFSRIDAKTTILTIQATEGADALTMKVGGGELIVTLNGVEERHNLADVKRIEAFLKDGNDSFVSDAGVAVNTYVFGDLGDDVITTGSGADTISGGAGKNQMLGGAGDDRINGSSGRDALDGQEGNDRLYGKGGNDDLTGGAGVDRLFGDEPVGPAGDDILRGGTSNDKLYGYGGNDTLVGNRQSDLLFGGDGDDLLQGGDGDDTLDGQAGSDTLMGEVGNDILKSDDGALDDLNGGDGNDVADADAIEKAIDLIEQVR